MNFRLGKKTAICSREILFSISALLLVVHLLGCTYKRYNFENDRQQRTGQNGTWQITNSNIWAKGTGLVNIESVIYDSTNHAFYVSCGVKYEVGTAGFISKITGDGHLQQLKWITGLNRPTGMAISAGNLYVADVNSVVVINIETGDFVDKIMAPVANPGINDVVITDQGVLFITASFMHAIYRVRGGHMSLWVQDEDNLTWANGIIQHEDKLVVGGLHLCTIDTISRQIERLALRPVIKDFDGIASDGQDGYFITTVEDSGLYHINHRNQTGTLLREDAYFGDLTFDPHSNQIYIPRGNHESNEYYLTILDCSR